MGSPEGDPLLLFKRSLRSDLRRKVVPPFLSVYVERTEVRPLLGQ